MTVTEATSEMHFIGGEFVDAKRGETFETTNLATEEKLADVASAGAEDVDAAGERRERSSLPNRNGRRCRPATAARSSEAGGTS